jgi:O-antigen ligase
MGRSSVEGSRFASGAWLTVTGAGVFALGCARLAVAAGEGTTATAGDPPGLAATGLRFVVPALLTAIGGLLAVGGPRLAPALRSSVIARGVRLAAAAVVEGVRPPSPGETAAARPRTGGAQAAARPNGASQPTVPKTGTSRKAGRLDPVIGIAIVLALAAGLAGGLSGGVGPAAIGAAGAVVLLGALVLHRPEVFLLVGAAFPWVDWVARQALGGLGSAWDDAFLLLSIVLLIWAVLFLRRAELWTVPILLPLVLSFAIAVGSVVINGVPGNVAVFALRVLFQPLLFYFLGFLFPKNKRWVQWTAAVFILASVALALHGLYQYVTHAPMPASWLDVREGDIGTRAYSIVENPNGLGAFLLMGTLLSLSLALRPGLRPIQRWVMAISCVLQLGGVAVTFSRGAWLGLGVGLIALFIMSYRRYLVPLVAAGVVGWFVVPPSFTARLTFAFSSAYVTKSLAAGRLYVWRMAVEYVAAHPLLGVGLGTFGGTTAVTFGFGSLWVDNFYLQLAAEGGLILLALFLWVLLRAAKGVVKGYLTTSDPYLRALSAGVFGGFIAVSVANVTASVWETLVVGVGFWFLAGLATSAALEISRDTSVGDRT